MKRDMDLIRELTLKLESYPKKSIEVPRLRPEVPEAVWVDGYDEEQLVYHLELIEEAGFIDTMNSPSYFSRPSWAGHDFLDSIRSPDVWSQTKTVVSAAGGWTVGLLASKAKTFLELKIKELMGGG